MATGGSSDNQVKIWDVNNGKEVFSMENSGTATYTVRWSGRGKFVVTSGADGSLRVWDAKTGKESGTLDKTVGYLHDYVFSRDGRFMAGVANGGITIWNLQTLKQERVLKGHAGGTVAAAFHPRGRFLASSGADGNVHIWDVVKGTVVKSVDIGQAGQMRIGWTRDGRQVVVPCRDNKVRFVGRK